jgi:rhamnosyltransferase
MEEMKTENTRGGKPNKIGSVTVLYHPDGNAFSNILKWAEDCEYGLIVDNSPQEWALKSEILNQFQHISYVHFAENLGIADALNYAFEYFKARGAEYVLTLDQDSQPTENMASHLDSILKSQQNFHKVGLISPFHQFPSRISLPKNSFCEELVWAMTSGNLVLMQAWIDVGGFDTDLFIDAVDEDFGRKLRLKGYSIIQANEIKMKHELGYRTIYQFFGFHFHPSNYSPLRRYYATRNRLYMIKRYSREFAGLSQEHLEFIKDDLVNILLFERRKLSKIFMTFVAIVHAFCGVKGKYKGVF